MVVQAATSALRHTTPHAAALRHATLLRRAHIATLRHSAVAHAAAHHRAASQEAATRAAAVAHAVVRAAAVREDVNQKKWVPAQNALRGLLVLLYQSR